MKLFELTNNYPIISTEALLIPAFKKIWDRDKTKGKDVATKELAYIYFTNDYKSIYASFPQEIKIEEVNKHLFGKEYTPDPLVKEAIEVFNRLQDTFNMRFLISAKGAAEKTMKYFDNIDYDERDIKGNFVYKVKEITQALKDCAGVLETLDKLIEKVSKEQKLKDSKVRGGGEPGFFEDK
jgi:hypothetical protein